jgi:hypothetical protein
MMADLKWEKPVLVNLNDIQKADGECQAGSSPVGGSCNCTNGISVFYTCSAGTIPDDNAP